MHDAIDCVHCAHYDLISRHLQNTYITNSFRKLGLKQRLIYKEAYMGTLNPTEMSNFRYISFLKFICQNQHLQIPIFMVYKAPDVQSTNIKHEFCDGYLSCK